MSKKRGGHRLPKFHQVRNHIAAIKRLDLRRVDRTFLIEQIRQLFHGYVTTTPILERGQKFYRAVKWDQKYSTVQRLSYPPADKVKRFGRVNRSSQSMFYCSVAWNAPLFELKLQPGDHIALSRWRTAEKLIVNNIGFTEAVFVRLNSDRSPNPSWKRRDGVSETPVNRLLHNFFSEEFAHDVTPGDEYLYNLSSAIGEILLHEIDGSLPGGEVNRMAGLAYPALAMLAHADNVVFKPDIVDKYLFVDQVEYMRVDSMEQNDKFVTYRSTHLDFSDTFDARGEIEWKGRPAHCEIVVPPGGRVRATIENGRHVFRDEVGNIIDPR